MLFVNKNIYAQNKYNLPLAFVKSIGQICSCGCLQSISTGALSQGSENSLYLSHTYGTDENYQFKWYG